MQVKNIECQIAQAQLRRYLTGEEMPSAIVTDLETHLRHCPECMAAAQTLRESLKGVLSGKITGRPETPKPEPARAIAEAAASGQAAVQTPADLLDAPDSDFKPKKAPKKSNLRTLLYTSALAILLVLMSTVFKDPTTLFGPRASSTVKDTPPAAANDAPTSTDAPIDSAVTNTAVATELSEPPATEPTVPPTGGTTTAPVAAEGPGRLETDGLIVADGATGTKQVSTDPPKQQPKPRPKASPKKRPTGGKSGVGTIRVYPPDK